MDKKLAFQILGISQTKEEEAIRSSYLALLKETNPEDDPEGFKRLREAYEEALRSAAECGTEKGEEEPQDEIGIWMKQVREVYRDIRLRRDIENWEPLFEDPVCVGFDTFLEARGRLLRFLSDHALLPQAVWVLLDRSFHVLEDFDALKEEFHVNFLKHIEYHVNTEDFPDYRLFETEEDYRPENDEEADEYIREYFQIRRLLEDNETEDVSRMLADIKRHGIYHPYEDVERLRLYIRQETCEKGRELAENLLVRYPEDDYVRVWAGKLFSDAGDEERGYALWKAVLEKEPDYYMAKYFAVGYLRRQKQWYQARNYINDLLRANGRDDDLLSQEEEINRELLPLIQAAYDKGEGFEDLKKEEVPLFLGRTIYNMERYEEALALIDRDPELAKKDKNNLHLKALTYYELERYQEAIPVFLEYLGCLDEVENEEERADRMAQAHEVLGYCYFDLENAKEGERELRMAISLERSEGKRLKDRYSLAEKFLAFQEYERAVEECDQLLSEDENYYPAYLVRQEASYHLKRAQQVVDDYYRAIDLYAGFDKPYLYAAMIFYDYNQYQDAIGVIERARENRVDFSPKLRFQEVNIRRMLAENADDRKKVMELLDALLTETEDENGELKEAETAAREYPKRAELLFEKALLFWDDEKLLDAVVLVQETLKLDPDNEYYHLMLGNILRDMGNYGEALKEYKRVENTYHHAEFYFGMGVCYQETENRQEAVAYYKKTVEQDETYRDTNHRLYREYLRRFEKTWKKEDYEAALFYINKQLEVTNNKAYRLWDRAYLYGEGMEIEKALADYREALETVDQEDRYIILENMGFDYKKDRQFEKAYECFKQAVEAMGKKDASSKGYHNMAVCMMKMKNYEQAIADFRAGLAVFPKDEDMWESLSDCYAETDRYEEALAVAKEWCAQAGKTVGYYNQVAYILLEMGKIRESLQCYEDAKKEFIQRAADKEELANLYEKWGRRLENIADFAASAAMYQDAAALYRDNWDRFDAECKLVRNCYMAGEREKAARYARRVLENLQERGTTVEDYISYTAYAPVRLGWMAWIELALGNREKALAYFKEMEQIRPCSGCAYEKCHEAALWLGYYYYSEKDLEKAAAMLEETLRRYEDSSEAKYLLEKIRGGEGAQPRDTEEKQGFMGKLLRKNKKR